MLKKWKNRKIRERNRADFLRFADLRLKMVLTPLERISLSDDAE